MAKQITFTRDELNKIINLLNMICQTIGYAEGREDANELRCAMRREEFKVIQFPSQKELEEEKKQNEKNL